MKERKPMNVYVVFMEDACPWILKILSRGFKHCFMAVSYDNEHWVIVDHLYPYTNLKVLSNNDLNVEIEKWKTEGHVIVRTTLNDMISENAHFGFLTCVETTKRIMKINNMLIQTPWQLYDYIVKNMPHHVVNQPENEK